VWVKGGKSDSVLRDKGLLSIHVVPCVHHLAVTISKSLSDSVRL
jgi:hypothetical protein